MTKKLAKLFMWVFLGGSAGCMFILLMTYPDTPSGAFNNVAAWTVMERVLCVPVCAMCLSLCGLLVLLGILIFRRTES